MLEHSPKDPNMSSAGRSGTVDDSSSPSDRELELEQIHLAVPRSLTFAAAVHQPGGSFAGVTGLANVRFIVVKEYKPKEGAEGGKLDPERLQNCPHTSTASTKVVKDGC